MLASTFLRFQEHYESPEFRGRAFTWEEFMDWYAARFGRFSYLEDWSGFNVPDTAFDAFVRGDFDPLTRKESVLLNATVGLERPHYVIGTVEGDDGLLCHEIAHALYHLDADYRDNANAELSRCRMPMSVSHLTATMGYDASVIRDELNAYIISGPNGGLPFWSECHCVFRQLSELFAATLGFRASDPRGCREFLGSCRKIRIG